MRPWCERDRRRAKRDHARSRLAPTAHLMRLHTALGSGAMRSARSPRTNPSEAPVQSVLAGKTGVIFGVANKRSIAWGCAQSLAKAGMRLAFTYMGERMERSVRE